MRYFFSSGELSGESSAIALAHAIRTIDAQAQFEGIGARAMREAGFAMWRDHTGWASMGPLAAIPRIPKLLATMWQTAFHLRDTAPDLVVLVDFGAFNLRLASTLRRLNYEGPILDVFPPGTWLDNAEKARVVASVAVALTGFDHQRRFYRSLGLPVAYFGHPLAGRYAMRPPRAAPPQDGGTIAVLPGSRSGELRFHLPPLIAAYRLLQQRRHNVRAVFGAADDRGAERIGTALAAEGISGTRVVRGADAAVADADAAWAASGTAVLEAALTGVPVVALYVVSPIVVKYGRRMIKHRFITLPNLVLGREVVPELLQEQATPQRLASEMERLLENPGASYSAFAQLREALGPPDALERCAGFAVDLARDPAAAMQALG